MTIERRMRAVRLCEMVREDPRAAKELGIEVKETLSAAPGEGPGARRKERSRR